jgi:hypothetical protein
MSASTLSTLPSFYGNGGIAVNTESTLFATVDVEARCVNIHTLRSDGTALP